MPNLLMVSGDRALAEGKHGAFYNTMSEFHKYWDRIDVITPKISLKSHQVFSNVFFHPSPWPMLLQPLWIVWVGYKIWRKNRFSLMTVHEYPPFYNGLGVCLLFHKIRVPYVLEIHHIPGYPRAGSVKESFYKLFFGLFIKIDSRKAKAVRVVNQRETPDFLIRHGIHKEKIKYIPSMYIDSDIFKPTPTSTVGAPTDSVGVEVVKKYDLVFAARLEKNKGIFELLRAVVIAKKQKPDIKLLIIGAGSLRSGLTRFIKENKLDDNVEFSGWLATSEDVAGAYSSARVFINPSYNEGGPRVVLEAMACGIPIITTRVGLMHDIIQDSQNGLFITWEPSDMAKKILMLLDNSEMQNKFSLVGLELVKNFYKKSQIENYAKRLQEIITINN